MNLPSVIVVSVVVLGCGSAEEMEMSDAGRSPAPPEEPRGCHIDCLGSGVTCESGRLLDHSSYAIDDPSCSMNLWTACGPREAGDCRAGCASDEELGRYGLERLHWELGATSPDLWLLCREGLPAEPGDPCAADECRFTLPRYDGETWLPQYYLACDEGLCTEVEPPAEVGDAPCEFASDCSLGWRCEPAAARVRGPGTCVEGLEPRT